MKIGIVDLDTSHPQHWVPIERQLGHQVVGVWDGGTVHPWGHAERFAKEYAIPCVFATIEEMALEVDCAFIHSCDWDTHLEKARPFLEAGKAVFIDKPVVGNLADLNQLREWIAQGARVFGGSSLWTCPETRKWLGIPASERGTPHTVFCGCGVDEFNYGIHAYAMLCSILGPGAHTAQYLSEAGQDRVWVSWPDGRSGLVVVGAAAQWIPHWASLVTEKGCFHYEANAAALYRALLEEVLPFLAGETDSPPLAGDDWLMPELCALAARQSRARGGRPVALSDLDDDARYDGRAFARAYREARRSSGTAG